jgi:hypothetical protein
MANNRERVRKHLFPSKEWYDFVSFPLGSIGLPYYRIYYRKLHGKKNIKGKEKVRCGKFLEITR